MRRAHCVAPKQHFEERISIPCICKPVTGPFTALESEIPPLCPYRVVRRSVTVGWWGHRACATLFLAQPQCPLCLLMRDDGELHPVGVGSLGTHLFGGCFTYRSSVNPHVWRCQYHTLLHIWKVNLKEHFASTTCLFQIRNILTLGAPITGLQTFGLRIALSSHNEV